MDMLLLLAVLVTVCLSPTYSQIGTTCATTRCQSGFVCKDTPTGPQCVPATREGKCPAMMMRKCTSNCTIDADCPGYQKCCSGGRFCKKCKNPVPSETCRNKKCPPGQKCVMIKVECKRAPCFDVPTCV